MNTCIRLILSWFEKKGSLTLIPSRFKCITTRMAWQLAIVFALQVWEGERGKKAVLVLFNTCTLKKALGTASSFSPPVSSYFWLRLDLILGEGRRRVAASRMSFRKAVVWSCDLGHDPPKCPDCRDLF